MIVEATTGDEEGNPSEFAELLKDSLENSSFLKLNNATLEVVEIQIVEFEERVYFFFQVTMMSEYSLIGNWDGDSQRCLFGGLQDEAKPQSEKFHSLCFVGSPQIYDSEAAAQHYWYQKFHELFDAKPVANS